LLNNEKIGFHYMSADSKAGYGASISFVYGAWGAELQFGAI
jgi:hypothetical protein